MGGNWSKTLNEIVSLEAWHDPFNKKNKRVDVHVDVAFLSGRLGGEDASEVRFILELRQAEIVVMIPPTEPARVDPGSVSRDAPQVEAKLVREKKFKRETHTKLGGAAKMDGDGVSLSASTGAGVSAAKTDQLRSELTEAIKNMRILHSLGPDKQHRWSVASITKDGALTGRPWDASEAPRLKVIDTRPDRERGLAPVVKVEVRCRREDLIIRNIQLKNVTGLEDRLKRGSRRNREVAAEAVIRSRLLEEGLLSGDIEDRFAILTLAAIEAQSD